MLDDELRRTTSSFTPVRLLLDERTAPAALEATPVRPVTTRTEELPVREEDVDEPVRDALEELIEPPRLEDPDDFR